MVSSTTKAAFVITLALALLTIHPRDASPQAPRTLPVQYSSQNNFEREFHARNLVAIESAKRELAPRNRPPNGLTAWAIIAEVCQGYTEDVRWIFFQSDPSALVERASQWTVTGRLEVIRQLIQLQPLAEPWKSRLGRNYYWKDLEIFMNQIAAFIQRPDHPSEGPAESQLRFLQAQLWKLQLIEPLGNAKQRMAAVQARLPTLEKAVVLDREVEAIRSALKQGIASGHPDPGVEQRITELPAERHAEIESFRQQEQAAQWERDTKLIKEIVRANIAAGRTDVSVEQRIATLPPDRRTEIEDFRRQEQEARARELQEALERQRKHEEALRRQQAIDNAIRHRQEEIDTGRPNSQAAEQRRRDPELAQAVESWELVYRQELAEKKAREAQQEREALERKRAEERRQAEAQRLQAERKKQAPDCPTELAAACPTGVCKVVSSLERDRTTPLYQPENADSERMLRNCARSAFLEPWRRPPAYVAAYCDHVASGFEYVLPAETPVCVLSADDVLTKVYVTGKRGDGSNAEITGFLITPRITKQDVKKRKNVEPERRPEEARTRKNEPAAQPPRERYRAPKARYWTFHWVTTDGRSGQWQNAYEYQHICEAASSTLATSYAIARTTPCFEIEIEGDGTPQPQQNPQGRHPLGGPS